MIKKLSALTLTASVYLTTALPAFAASINPCPRLDSGFFSLCGFNLNSVNKIVRNSITILFIVAVIAALFFLIYGGIRWITSGGDKARLESARNIIVAAIIGLILTFLIYFIINIILQLFGLSTVITSFEIPKLIQ